LEGKQYYIRLLEKYAEGTATLAEERDLFEELSRGVDSEQWQEIISQILERGVEDPAYDTGRWESAIERILRSQPQSAPVHRIHFLRTAWFRYAAAIIILFGIGTYLYINNQKEKPSVTQTNPVPVQNDVAPGGNKATLTLADGSKIVLDSAKSGQLAREANATIIKMADGKIVYDADEKLGDKILFNTMATPRGGQYQLTLPDGSQVWLNAESSITYPTAFSGSDRKVSITGEAYFEVAKNKSKPFIVSVSTAGVGGPGEAGTGGGLEIEVLGTHFNVNSYKEEPTKNITLLEGSVRLSTLDSRLSTNNSVHTLILKPGQQGQLTDRGLFLAANPDLDQVMAWKNGRFKFGAGMQIEEIFRQISRWYDVDITYEGKITGTIGGSLSRQVNISKVLELMQSTGTISYRIEGKRVVVSPPKK